MVFPPHITQQNLSICHLEALNALAAVKVWEPIFTWLLVHLFSDNSTSVAIFQAGKCRDAFIQACSRDVRLTCTAWNITLVVGNVSGASRQDTADALSCWDRCQQCQKRVDKLLGTHDFKYISVPEQLFHLSLDL